MQDTNITIWIAFAAGVISFLTPCVLPLVPGYISLISGISVEHLKEGSKAGARRAVMLNSLAFNAGLSIIFLALGTTAGWVGGAVLTNPWVRIIGGIVIIVFGFQMLGWLKISALYKDTRFFSSDKPSGLLGSMLLGLAFAGGWTPCIGPILGGIIGLAAESGGWKKGLVLSAFYSAGLAIPFLLAGLGINQFLGFYARFRKYLHTVEVVAGVILIAIGLLVMTNRMTTLSSTYLAKILPAFEEILLPHPKGNPPPHTGTTAQASPAPKVHFTKLDGGTLALEDLKGKVVILNFWATWCVPCRSEIPTLNAMQKDLGSRGLSVIGVSYDDTKDLIESYQSAIKQDYQVVLGGNQVSNELPASPLPTTYFIDRDGNIRDKHIGEMSRADFEAIVKPLLDQGTVTASR